MRIKGRRRLDVGMVVLGSLATGAIVAIGAVSSNNERIDRMWVGAQVDADGTSAIHEVIDYNFGNASERHGLLHDIPGLTPTSPFTVSSPDAPDGINSDTATEVGGEPGVEIRVGDATQTVSGRHRYVLDYRLSTLTGSGKVKWDAVGAAWTVPVSEADIELVAPWQLDDLSCVAGTTGSTKGCTITQPEPGHLHVHASKLKANHGVTIFATEGAALPAAPALPNGPSSLPADPGAGIAEPTVLATLAALGAALAASRLVRRAGRERIGAGIGGAADAAFVVGSTSERRIDAADLADLATTEFAPPDGLTPSMGGIILAEAVQPNHKVAWLIGAAIDGAVHLEEEGGKTVRIDRTAPGDATSQPILDLAFGGRTSIDLGKYDATFASGWTALGAMLTLWEHSSGMWDLRAHTRKIMARALGVVFIIAGVAGAGVGGALSSRYSPSWLTLTVAGALVAGIGIAMVIRGWELEVRTPLGSGQWLRVESFRRFLHESEAHHAEEAAKRGVLREYTAWAVALDEIDRWKHAVESSTTIPSSSAGLSYAYLAPLLVSSTSHASTAPSSSGGGGGGVGGGGGGGGGGSW